MVMVPMPDTSGYVPNGNQQMTGNGQTGNVPANGPMNGMGMLVHGPDCHIPGTSMVGSGFHCLGSSMGKTVHADTSERCRFISACRS